MSDCDIVQVEAHCSEAHALRRRVPMPAVSVAAATVGAAARPLREVALQFVTSSSACGAVRLYA